MNVGRVGRREDERRNHAVGIMAMRTGGYVARCVSVLVVFVVSVPRGVQGTRVASPILDR